MAATYGASEVFFDGAARYALVRAFDGGHAGHAGHAGHHGGDGSRLLTPHEARWALARILGPGRGAEIVAAYRSLLRGPLPVAGAADVHPMREALLDAVGRGHLLVFEATRVGSSARREVDEDDAPPPPPSAPSEEKTWIAILLTDDRDPPQPVAFTRYRIDLPDGSTREGILDAYGKARLDGIDPGTCRVTFPGLDGKDWS